MGFLSVLSFAQELAGARIRPGDTALDATAGNGVDTLFLAKADGVKGAVHAFDIQETALAKTRDRLWKELGEEADRVQLHLASHDQMKELVPVPVHGAVAAVMFNLGYLPGADHTVITRPGTTLPALSAALELLRPGGVLTVAVYPGHEGGRSEADAVDAWASQRPPEACQVMCYRFMNQRNNPPYLIALEKR
jgi:predicted methyltransferase